MARKWGSGFSRKIKRYRAKHNPNHLHYWIFNPQMKEGVAMPYGSAWCRCGKQKWVADIDKAKEAQSKRVEVWRAGGIA